ncbi:MAG TPA: Ni/Fe hydrogenase subunit alpha [Candidatus Aenigmarchaeota archaeon]|nr:Ni/Fe hydrogenase subunit alpha [Candidatus Aenigmarchaeota archaeon]
MEEIKVSHLTKVEGHAKLTVKFDKEKKRVRVCVLEVFESPRYFEVLIKGRSYKEVPYLASRICGVCNIAHLIGSMLAVENALKIEVTEQTKLLRELLVLGGIIHSHVLHLYLLALPDYLGYSSALDMTGKHLRLIKRGLTLKEVGNDIVNVIGGRSIHPLTAVIGGFTKLPKQENLDKLLKNLEKMKKEAIKTVELFASLKAPKVEFKTEFMALSKVGVYSFIEGNIKTLSGFEFKPKDYKKYLEEKVIRYSTSKHVTFKRKSFMVGPLARINIHSETLSKDAKKLLEKSKFNLPNYNVYSANLARAIEVIHCIDRTIEILSELKLRKERPVEVKVKRGEGVSATEAPRGVLYHHYRINKEGKVTYVNIIPPTTQNTKSMEDTLKQLLLSKINLPKRKLVHEMEKLIRAYDPCFSCSAHFLEVKIIK